MGRLVLAVVLLVAYSVVVIAYGLSISSSSVSQRIAAPPDGVSLHFIPTGLDAAAGAMPGLMYVLPGAHLLDAHGRLTRDLAVEVQPVLGNGTATFAAGQVPAPINVIVGLDGNVRDYPFDSYGVDIVSSASTRPGAADPWSSVPVVVGTDGDLGGWALAFATPASTDFAGTTFTADEGYGIQQLGARRALSTMAFAILMLILMVLLAVMTAYVARAVALRRKRIEPSLASWMAALLFALIPLRNFLPGAPPLGSWIDVLVFFWVEVVIMIALAAYVATWLRDGAPSEWRASR